MAFAQREARCFRTPARDGEGLRQAEQVAAVAVVFIDQPQVLAESLGANYQYVFAPTLSLQGGRYGIAALSRLRFLAVAQLPLSNQDAREPRTAIDALLCAGRRPFRVVNHHADYDKPGAVKSTQEILATYHPGTVLPSVFAGDYNQLPSDPGPTAFVGLGLSDVLAEHDDHPTFGRDRIDYFFVDPAVADRVDDAMVVPSEASDHSLIVMDVLAH